MSGEETAFDLTDDLRRVRGMLTMHRGLYVQYLRNDSIDPVYDRNRELDGRGKLLIRPNGRTIKIGKFVGGFLARRALDALHMHRRSGQASPSKQASDEFIYPPALGVYLDCLERIFALDLGALPKPKVAMAETALRQALDRFLNDNKIPVEDRRGDYRILTHDPGSQFVTTLENWARGQFMALHNKWGEEAAVPG